MFLAHPNPAGGAPLLQVVFTGLIALTFLAPTLLMVAAERRGQRSPAGRLADRIEARTGLLRWAGLPSVTLFASLLSAGVGVYWDVPYHVDFGRDEGPLANPAHYLILFGLLGVFASGLLSCGLASGQLPRRTLPVAFRGYGWPDWRVPLGSAIITACGGFALLGFPLDDIWHRIYGQDVTEWGPTHILMIGGAVISTLGGAMLAAESRQAQVPSPGRDASRESAPAFGASGRWIKSLEWHYALWWLLGISAFLMEYDLGVPQFPMVAQVAIIAIAAGWPLVWARSVFGPGGALLAAVVFVAARAILMVIAGDVFGRTPHHFNLFLAQAVAIELLALVLPVARRQLFGVAAGVLVGTLGTLAEYAWTQVFLPLPWHAAQLPVYLVYGVAGGVGGGLIAAWQLGELAQIGSAPDSPAAPPARHAAAGREWAVLVVGAVLAFGVMAVAVPRTADTDLHGTMSLQRVGDGRAEVTVKLDDPHAADGANWFYALSWQGGGSVAAPMRKVGDGVYRSSQPMPVTGDWKTLVRLHTGTNRLVSLPVYLPGDRAIPVDPIPATSGVTRPYGAELHLLQREATGGLPDALWYGGYATLLAIYVMLLGLITALYVRAAGTDHGRPRATRTAQPPRTRQPQAA